jgi:hypothetical protein
MMLGGISWVSKARRSRRRGLVLFLVTKKVIWSFSMVLTVGACDTLESSNICRIAHFCSPMHNDNPRIIVTLISHPTSCSLFPAVPINWPACGLRGNRKPACALRIPPACYVVSPTIATSRRLCRQPGETCHSTYRRPL